LLLLRGENLVLRDKRAQPANVAGVLGGLQRILSVHISDQLAESMTHHLVNLLLDARVEFLCLLKLSLKGLQSLCDLRIIGTQLDADG
jgi:hypothetical protein